MDEFLCAGCVSGYDLRLQTGLTQLMALYDNGDQPRGAGAAIQGRPTGRGLRIYLTAFACLLSLSACSRDISEKPAAWWHETIGGKINEQRPAPPGDKDPYPNLATIPPKPPPADAASWNRLTAGLTADRIVARQAAALAPIPATSVPAATTQLVDPKSPDPGASAALQATTSPPSALETGPPNAKSPALSQTASAAPLPELQTPPTPPPAAYTGDLLPPLPTREPPRPDFAPGPPPRLVAVTVAPPREVPRPAGDSVDFSPGSTDLTLPALELIQTLAAGRGDHGIAVIGYGGAATADPLVQSQALDLAMRRAQALATALVAQGVPYAALRIDAEAAGRGAILRLLQ
jgi:outer membrane protein OmpA-like peptidoglycan-associated protein